MRFHVRMKPLEDFSSRWGVTVVSGEAVFDTLVLKSWGPGDKLTA